MATGRKIIQKEQGIGRYTGRPWKRSMEACGRVPRLLVWFPTKVRRIHTRAPHLYSIMLLPPAIASSISPTTPTACDGDESGPYIT